MNTLHAKNGERGSAALFLVWITPIVIIMLAFSQSMANPLLNRNIPDSDVGAWETWVIESAESFRISSPPGTTVTKRELTELRQRTGSLDGEDIMRIQYWNAGAPGYRWNQIAKHEALYSDLLLNTYRLISYLNAAIYDATVAAWDLKYTYNRHRPGVMDPSISTVIPSPESPSWPSEHAVTAGAAEVVLSYFLPDRADKFRSQAEEAAQAFVNAGIQFPSDARAGLELGRKIGAKVVEYAQNDGSDTVWEGERPTGYGIYNLLSQGDEAIGTWKTWVLSSGSEFRPPPPPAPDSEKRKTEIAEILKFQEERDSAPYMELFFWPEDPVGRPDPGSFPVQHSQVAYYYSLFNTTMWLTELHQKLFEYRLTENPPLAAYAYAFVGAAFYDAFIATWDGRFAYWVARPEEFEPSIQPILTTYDTPEYPSGHSAISAATTEALTYLFPADAHFFRSRTRELAESRVWAGIHFRSSCEAGLEMGRKIARKVIEERGLWGRQVTSIE
jgi:membrane-associated phospholipid phosphatase